MQGWIFLKDLGIDNFTMNSPNQMSHSNIQHIRNSIFYLRPKNVSYHKRLSGNKGQCFLYKGCKLIAFHVSLQIV